jgi:hypothetical protein
VRHIRWTILIIAILAAGGCDSKPVATNTVESSTNTVESSVASKTYTLPSEAFLDATAERGPEGEVFITCSTNLPDTLRIGVELPDIKSRETVKDRPGIRQFTLLLQDLEMIVKDGRFRSHGFMANKYPIRPGKYNVHFIAHFNGAWQTREMLNVVGSGGKHLKGKIFKKEDPDVIDSDLILDYTATILFPPRSLESQAIDLVKEAILTVPGKGRSATNIQENLELFMGMGSAVRPTKGWSAKAEKGKTFLVVFTFMDGHLGEQEAIWSANLETKTVQYVNKYAKMFSWTPNY